MKKKAVKKSSRKTKKPFEGFFDRILASLFESIEENTEDLVDKLGNIAFVKSVFKKYFVIFIISSAALVMLSYGLGMMVNFYFPIIELWMTYIGLGILLFLIGLIYKQLK